MIAPSSNAILPLGAVLLNKTLLNLLQHIFAIGGILLELDQEPGSLLSVTNKAPEAVGIKSRVGVIVIVKSTAVIKKIQAAPILILKLHHAHACDHMHRSFRLVLRDPRFGFANCSRVVLCALLHDVANIATAWNQE